MSARDEVLRRIEAALADRPEIPTVPREYVTSGSLHRSAVLSLFAARVDDYRADVHRCEPDGLPAVVARIVAEAGIRQLAVPAGIDGAWLSALGGDVEVVRDDPAWPPAALDGVDAVCTGAAVGIAETGTIVLDGSPTQGRRALTLIPDHHICVVRGEHVVQSVPEGFARLRTERPLTLISGPSATSDIELDRVEGVHGPRTLDVVLVAPLDP